MTTPESFMLPMALFAGMMLGAVFFGGLWLTIRWCLSSAGAPLWVAGSLFVRTGIVLFGFYAVFDGYWGRLVACVVGFAIARYLITWWLQSSRQPASRSTVEASRAP